MATSFVKASAQAQFVNDILPLFNEEELAIFKRARNAKKVNKAKSASISDYNLSTGFEAVLGYLHLTGQTDRLNYLLYKGNKDED
jgi:ribonuclease-3 family protein